MNGRAIAATLMGACTWMLAQTVAAAPPGHASPGPGAGGPPPAAVRGAPPPPARAPGAMTYGPAHPGAPAVRGYYGGAYWGPYGRPYPRPYWGWPAWPAVGVAYGWPYAYGWSFGYGYPPVAYPPAVVAVPSAPPVYVEQAPAMTEPQPGYWYYCDAPAGYYPEVAQCPGGWRAVAPQPPVR